jgi:predicted transglutaminase-like cysteine proteinase
MLITDLDRIHSRVLAGFTYQSDEVTYSVKEKWVTPEDADNVIGDCQDFALACRKLCREAALQTRLIICMTETGEGHCVLECEGYIFDNRRLRVAPCDDFNYKWVSISGHEPDDPWYEIDDLAT